MPVAIISLVNCSTELGQPTIKHMKQDGVQKSLQ